MIRSQIAENRDSNSRFRLSAVEPVQNRGTENAVRMARNHSRNEDDNDDDEGDVGDDNEMMMVMAMMMLSK